MTTPKDKDRAGAEAVDLPFGWTYEDERYFLEHSINSLGQSYQMQVAKFRDAADAQKVAGALMELADAKDDALRLHKEKMDYYEQNAALLARVGELEAALKPFAEGAKEIPDDFPDTGLLIPEGHPHNPKKYNLLIAWVRDFRRAAAALKPKKD
jgi:hypothetical protein